MDAPKPILLASQNKEKIYKKIELTLESNANKKYSIEIIKF